jgi:hypothetical protein
MKVKELSKKLLEGVEKLMKKQKLADPKVRVNFLRHYVGEAFQKEAKERVSARFRGEVDVVSVAGIRQELYSWGFALSDAVGVPTIDRILFDRITDSVVQSHNDAARTVRTLKENEGRVKRREEREVENKVTKNVDISKYLRPETLTLGHAVGIVE